LNQNLDQQTMSKIRVALIEDHDLTRFGIRTFLQQQPDIEVVGEARDGRSGLRLLETSKPDVAIVDIGLPDMTGIEVTHQLRQQPESEEAPRPKVLIMTLQDDQEVVLAAFATGADSYCMKNASPDQLCDAVRVTAEGNAWVDPAIARIVLSQVRSPQAAVPEQDSKITINRLSDEEQAINYPLTERELDVLRLIVDGRSNAEIGEQLYITVGTVKTHVRNILNKLSVDDRTQIAVRALRSGLVQ
jgi:DNA-binding NarL/FixJ family response regulator